MSGTNWVKRGSLAGTGANIKINCGFKPVKVELYNEDSGDEAHKTQSMAGAFAQKRVAAGGGAYTDTVCSLQDDGFTIEADADVNAAGETIHYVAYQAHND